MTLEDKESRWSTGDVAVPEKMLLFGIDCGMPKRWRAFAERGQLPTAKRLLDEGVYATRCLPVFPTLTPTNWASIATGAWPATHGITDFSIHEPGAALDDCPQAFDSSLCEAEYIWAAAERDGKKSIVVNFPTTYPTTLTDGVQLGGGGLDLNDWRVGLPTGPERMLSLAAEQLFSSLGVPLCSDVPPLTPGTPVTLRFEYRDTKDAIDSEPLTLYASLCGEKDDHAVRLSSEEAPNIAELRVGEWSPRIDRTFRVDGREVTGSFRCKLLSLEATGGFSLYVTDICASDGWEIPPGVLAEASDVRGLPIAGAGFEALSLGWIDLETFVEVNEMLIEWLGAVCAFLLERRPWDLFFIQFHSIDYFYHVASQKLDVGRDDVSEAERKTYEDAELRIYAAIDAVMGRLIGLVKEPLLTVLTSDHGAMPFTRHVSVARILNDAGLLRFTDQDTMNDTPWGSAGEIDWARTSAVPQRCCYVYVNLEGRDPDGSVPPPEYRDVQEGIVRALKEYNDPETGLNPFSLVLKKDDAGMLGLGGDRIGDVVYAVRAEFSDEHGQYLGSTDTDDEFGSLRAMFVAAGPGVRRGVDVTRTMWLTDIVPTVCYLLGLPVPRDAEGSVVYQALDYPDGWAGRYRALAARHQAMEREIQRRQALTHRYDR